MIKTISYLLLLMAASSPSTLAMDAMDIDSDELPFITFKNEHLRYISPLVQDYEEYEGAEKAKTRLDIISALNSADEQCQLQDSDDVESTISIAKHIKAKNIVKRLNKYDAKIIPNYDPRWVTELLKLIIEKASARDLKTLVKLRSTCTSFNHLTRFSELHLDLSSLGKNVTDDTLGVIAEMFPNIKTLDLSGCENIIKAGLAHLKDLPNLQSLNLFGCVNITNTGLASLNGMINLRYLDLRRCMNITETGLASLNDMTNLQSLNLTYCYQITNLSSLNGMINLQSLNLSGCTSITDLAPLNSMKNLQFLDLSGCTSITNTSLASLNDMISLQSLNLSKCSRITNDGLRHLKDLSNLQSLNLTYCYQITDLASLNSLTSLHFLDLSENMWITDLAPLNSLTSLQFLDLSRCNRITNDSISQLREYLPNLKIKR